MRTNVQVVLKNTEGLYLAVSRKDDHNDFGLVGGKVDPEDNSPEEAAIRETKEETGLDIFNLKEIHNDEWKGDIQITYTADWSGEINYTEPHVVKWAEPQVFIDGKFGDYNDMIFNMFTPEYKPLIRKKFYMVLNVKESVGWVVDSNFKIKKKFRRVFNRQGEFNDEVKKAKERYGLTLCARGDECDMLLDDSIEEAEKNIKVREAIHKFLTPRKRKQLQELFAKKQ